MANSVAFSPDGRLLAAAGPDAVTVWELEKREEPIAIWRAEGFSRDEWDPSLDGQISLEWDHNSARLSISIGNQVRTGLTLAKYTLTFPDRCYPSVAYCHSVNSL
jgi:WD40 repeat protein